MKGYKDRQDRSQRLQHLHDNLVQLVIHEGRFVSERTNIFLLFNSLFFAGFVVLRVQPLAETGWTLAATVLVPALGLMIGGLQILLISKNVVAANFWRNTAKLIQEDGDFWWPGRKDGDDDLGFFIARSREAKGESTRQTTHPFQTGGKHLRFVHSNTILGIRFPAVFIVLWIFALSWGIALVIAATTNQAILILETSVP